MATRKSISGTKLRAAICSGFFLFALLLSAGAYAEEFEDAGKLYDAGKYADAKQRYEQLVKTGKWSANLFYNLGDVEFRLGAPGRAILQYERALALDPGHPEATANLRFVRERAGARVEELSWLDQLASVASVDQFTVLAATTVWLALACLVALLLIQRCRTRLLTGFFLCLFIAVYSGWGAWKQSRNLALAIIVANQVEARLAPADRAGLAETLPAGSRVRVLSERGDWIYCALPGKGLGWIPATALERVQLHRS